MLGRFLIKRLWPASKVSSSSRRALSIASYSSSYLCLASKMIDYSQKDFGRSKRQYGCFFKMLLHGQAVLLLGGSSSLVFAEKISNETASEIVAGGSADAGVQRVEDGSVISNEHTIKWRIFTDNGREFFVQGKLVEAENFFSSALVEAKKGFGERDPHVASACNNLAEFYRVQKLYDKAEPLYLDGISILEEAYGPDDVRVGAAFHNLGQFYIGQRKFEEARVCYERSLKIKGRILGHRHADYAETMFHLGTVLYLQGHVEEAEALVQDSIRILEEGGQGESFSCIRKLRYLAKIYIKSTNQLSKAENVQRKILHIMEFTKGWDSLATVIAAESLSITLQYLGKLRDARELLERCLDARRTLLPKDHIQVGGNLLGLANLALLNFKQMKKIGTSNANMELDRAKEFLTNAIRIAECVLDGTKEKKIVPKYGQGIGKDEHLALTILLQSLKALAHVEIAKLEDQETTGALPVLEAEKSLRHCIHAFRKYGAVTSTSIPIEVKSEYISCLKDLLSLITEKTKNAGHFRKGELQELKDEIRCVEEEILGRKL
ncbi:uncharacterized protein LOC130804876 isoform X2 [Amaranthus tricolor]|uniref:uncharacterized protein LOC130804876 isoform X2 n=1 Tax=Amaranthus tricolor TaxID=29722 RepID=UPI002590F29F|nr:uncharacterized protein LOC130804876 isoform X2 [Amaranthus tricolor]